ncbi:MAG: phage tail protein, partial [Caldilineaceae bacterium]|nr:phage tail protein [Caldilineaceae bacterium]
GNPDPYRGYRFRVELDGVERAGFQECSGLDFSQDPIEYREGPDPLYPRKLPGLTKYSNITLKWGITKDEELWDWREQALKGTIQRKNGSIILVDDEGNDKTRWNFEAAWPAKWTGPTFNATANEVAVETLEIAHEVLKKA